MLSENLQAAVDRVDATVESFEDAMAKMRRSASSVESSVTEEVQPDLRELRLFIVELNEKADLRLKRIHLALIGLFALNAAILTMLALR